MNMAWLQHPHVQTLLAAFGDVPLRFVGGCVRDSLSGRTVADKDAATPATPQQVMELLKAAGLKAVPTGIEHGTVTAVVEGEPFEITTLRRDVACDGRHAQVAFTDDWQEDAARRDFTMNALYCDAQGQIYDYFDGEADARNGLVRFIGDPQQRIREDGLRILRFFRFFATHGNGEADAASLAACQAQAQQLKQISGERIRSEMLKLLAAADPLPALEGMVKTVLPVVLPAHDYQVMPLALPDPACDQLALLRLALLLRQHPQPEAAVARCIKAWQMSRRQQMLLHLLGSHKPVHLPESAAGWMPLRRHHRWEDFEALVWLEASEQRWSAEVVKQQLAELVEMPVPQIPLRGGDLKQYAGIGEGSAMGEMLRRAERYWEAKDYKPTRMDLVHYVKSLIPPKP